MFVEFKVNPVPSVWVKVVSESAPKLNTAASLNSLRSSPMTASFATDKPPSVCSDPSVVEVASVVSSVLQYH